MLLLPCDFEANKKGSLEGTKSFADFGMCPKAEKNEMTRNGTHVPSNPIFNFNVAECTTSQKNIREGQINRFFPMSFSNTHHCLP